MKVLWIAHDVLPEFAPYVFGHYTRGGSWVAPLFYALARHEGIDLGIITPVVGGKYQHQNIAGLDYFSIPIRKGGNVVDLSSDLLRNYLSVITEFQPDLIHIHGIEKNFGLLRKFIMGSIPIVCSIQGIITSYIHYLRQAEANIDRFRFKSLRTLLGFGAGMNCQLREWKRYALIEEEIVHLNHYFIGRTEWDRAEILAMNPNACYFHGEELLREEFYSVKWSYHNCEKYSIFIPSGAYSIKGLHVLLEAVKLLVPKYPQVRVYVPLFRGGASWLRRVLVGHEYDNYVFSLANEVTLRGRVNFLPRLSAADMASRMSKSHVFALASFVENSPNSLGEAMMLGVPSVTSYCGGVGSIIQNGSSLVYPVGDSSMLAFQLDQLFQSQELANDLSHRSRSIAAMRHDVASVTQSYLHIYEKIIKLHVKR